MNAIKRICQLTLICLILSYPAQAQDALGSNNGQPLEVTADGSLEWLRNDNQFVARQNAKAQQGTSSITADTLTAFYREGNAGQNMQIWKIVATGGDVTIKSNDSTLYGQNATYNLDDGLAVVTGNNLKMIAPDQTVTARDKFEYQVNKGRINALGKAKVTRPKPKGGQDVLEADEISAFLKKDKNGKQVLDKLEANGNVIITTPMERVTGKSGTFNAAANTAELKGGVKIKRGKNVLEGERATVNLNTNISKIFGSKIQTKTNGEKSATGRVRGIFYPGSENK